MDSQLLREFLAEADELTELLHGDLSTLRARYREGRARRELIARLFRHVHTLKGSAAAAELDVTSELAHEFEALLDAVRRGRLAVTESVMDLFDECAVALEETLHAATRGETQRVAPALAERLKRLARFRADDGVMPESPSPHEASPAAMLPGDLARSLSEYEEIRLREVASEGLHVYIIDVNFDLGSFDERFRDLSDGLAENGEVISTLPGMQATAPDQINFRLLYATEASAGAVAARVAAFSPASISEVAMPRVDVPPGDAAPGDELASTRQTQGRARDAIRVPSASLVRVDLDTLDDIVSEAHDVFTETMAALESAAAGLPGEQNRSQFKERAAMIRTCFIELEERLISLRMVPVAQTLQRAVRAGRMAARALHKNVEFETVGGDVRLDKSLADAVFEPLLHLVRNAVDHGIETPEQRVSNGRSAAGHVRVETLAEGNFVRIRVSDDGRGIDRERVRAAAIERGIIDPNGSVSEQQALRLIFRPGFSTAASVSEVSGRGVGLDVVERAIERVGGELHISSTEGQGVTLEMLLPTTLGLARTMIVNSAGYSYCIDTNQLEDLATVEADSVSRDGDRQVINWNGSTLPLVSLRDLLGQSPADRKPGESLHVLISRPSNGSRGKELKIPRVAIAVDKPDASREVLVRSLGRHSARWRGVAGATELADGSVALVLDLAHLFDIE